MAEFTLTFEVAGQTAQATKVFTDTRALTFLDDMIEHFPMVADGSGGERLMTRIEVGVYYLDKLLSGQIAWAGALERVRIKRATSSATDLNGE